MDKAPDYGSGDSRIESWHGRISLPFCHSELTLRNVEELSKVSKKNLTHCAVMSCKTFSHTSAVFFFFKKKRVVQRGAEGEEIMIQVL